MSHCCFYKCPLEIYKNLGPPLCSITFTVNSRVDNHFYKYIYLFQILHSMKSVLLLKYTLTSPLFFLMKAMVYRKKIIYRKNSFLAVGYLAVTELHTVHT